MSYSEPERSLDRLAGFTREAQSAAPRGGGSRRAAATQTDRVVFLIARASANLADGLDRLTPAGHAARAFLECERALVELRACTRCVVLLDLELAGATELIDALRDRPGVAVVALVDGPPEAASALAQGVDDVAVRPWTPSALQLRAQAAAARVDRSYSPKGATGFDAWATHTDDALALLDEAGRVLVWNLGAVAILGHEPRAMVGRSFFDLLVDPDDPVRDELLVGNAANHPVTLRRFEGHPQEFSLTVTRWQEGGRRRIGLRIEELGSAQVEDELMRLASFPELDPNPVFELRGAGEVSYANPAMRALPEVDEATLIASVREAIANYHEADGVSLTRELPCGDAWFEQHIHFAPAWDSIRVYAQNITERKAAERRLIEARDTLEHRVRERTADLQHEVEIRKLAEDRAREANEAKSAFLATMSHELRTPLNAIIGFSEMILDETTDDETASDLRKVLAAAHHLLGIINDILDLSKIESGRAELVVEPVDLRALIDDVTNTLRPLASARENALLVRYEGALERCETDVTKLRQVLINLIGNASKFTRAGTIEVAAQRIEIRGEGWVEIAISDTGIGIPADKLERIFHPFTQADNSTTRQYGGTGLGLTICKKICVMLGGTIMVESEVGVGSTFTIVLPAGV